MANEQNLIPMSERTKSEQRKLTSKGGKASGAARRRKKTMKQAMNLLLSMPVSDETKKKLEKQFSINPEDADNQMLLMVAAMQKAMSGNVEAMKFIASITGNIAMTEAEREKTKIEKKRLKMEEQQANKENDTGEDVVQSKMDAITGIVDQMQPLGDDET